MAKKLSTKTLVYLLLMAIALYLLFRPTSGFMSSPIDGGDDDNSKFQSVDDDDDDGPEMDSPPPAMMYAAPPATSESVGDIVGMSIHDDDGYADMSMSGSINFDGGCAMNAGVGLASSLMPRDVAPQEQYGQFAPDDILKGQNFLDPRQQVGWPETIGGTIRNGNQQLRADPPNPKDAYVWNNSTIVPDLMQRNLCT